MSKHTPGPWTYVPRHICEGEPEVRAPEGWLICCTASDEDARLIAAAPDWKARAEAAEADLAAVKKATADPESLDLIEGLLEWRRACRVAEARIADLEARLARVPDREAVARAIAAETLRQDYMAENGALSADLKVAYLDQGEVDFGLVADAAIAAMQWGTQ